MLGSFKSPAIHMFLSALLFQVLKVCHIISNSNGAYSYIYRKKHEKGDAGIPFEIQYQKGIYISNGLNIYRMIQISVAVGFMFVSQFYKRRKQRRRREQSREV